jgi:hypothetical protein
VSEAGRSASVPEAWVGRPVELTFISGGSTEYTDGDLQEVNDRGIVLSWRPTSATRRGPFSTRGALSSNSQRHWTDEGSYSCPLTQRNDGSCKSGGARRRSSCARFVGGTGGA